jgi:hypothetical protein
MAYMFHRYASCSLSFWLLWILVKKTRLAQLRLLESTTVSMTAVGILSRRPNVAEYQTPDARKNYREMLRKVLSETGKSQEVPDK